MPPNPLDRFATPNYLYTLAQANHLTPSALEYALRRIGTVPGAEDWRHFIDKVLLLLATTLLLAGIIFFFAYNWAEMHRFIKFAVLQVALLSMALFASLRGLERLSGQAALLAAAVLLGALLAVYGQTYQTGADAFGLFLTWAILIIPWVLLSSFAPMWLLLLVLLNLSLILYWDQVVEVHYNLPDTAFPLLLFLLNAIAMFAWEFTYKQGLSWLKGYWLGMIIFCIALTVLMIPTLQAIIEFGYKWQSDPLLPVAAVLYTGLTSFILWYYRYQRHDLLLLAVSLLSVIIVLTTLIIKMLPINVFTWLILALAVIGQASLATKWLQQTAKTWQQEAQT